MNIDEMIRRKIELGYSNEKIAELSGVPLGTVQKIFSGRTKSPRFQTLDALAKVLEDTKSRVEYTSTSGMIDMVAEKSTYGTSALNIKGKNIEDYLNLPEGARIELVDGVFYDMASPSFVHQQISGLIYNVLCNHVNKYGGSCIPSIAPTDVQLDGDDKTMVQPDVLVVCDREKIIKERVVGAPDLVIEVLSPSNWYMDMVRKLIKYKNAGVREYWIILPDQKLVMVYNFAVTAEFKEYTFENKVPVAIWDNKCEVNFAEIYEKIKFLYD
jgi:Uma2 family endonuclease